MLMGLLVGCTREDGEEPPAVQEAEVHGYVYASLFRLDDSEEPDATLLVPDVEVYLRDPSTSNESPRVNTDLKGFFMIPAQPNGTYELCAEAPGYDPSCSQVEIAGLTVYAGLIEVQPHRGFVFGDAKFTDGVACHYEDALFAVSSRTTVSLVDASGSVVVPPVHANILGQYLLPEVPSGAFRLRAECESARVERSITAFGANRENLTLPNSSTLVNSVVTFRGADGIRKAVSGETVRVEVSVSDPEGDPTHYQWAPSDPTAGFVSQDADAIDWELPASQGLNAMYVLVSDGRGAYSLGKVDLSTSPGVLFTGVVGGSNVPILQDATVDINGQVATTNSAGFFQITVPVENDRYVVNIGKPGYQLLSKVFTSGVVDGRYLLLEAQEFVVDPADDIRVSGEGQGELLGAEVQIPANTLVDQGGNQVSGPVNLFLSTFDLTSGRFPGDYGATDVQGREVSLDSYGAIQVDLQDASGDPVTLDTGASAVIRVPIHPDQLSAPIGPPPTVPLWSYDQADGLWREDGVLRRAGNFYEGEVTHFSVFNADVEFTNPACMRLLVNTARLRLPLNVRIEVPTSTGIPRVFDTILSDALSVAVRLPANTAITIRVRDSAGNLIPLATTTQNSGAPNSGSAFPAYPYAECNSQAQLSLGAPSGGPFLAYVGLSDAAEAANYYTAIDPSNSKTTLAAWKTANGFDSGDDASAVYFNAGDLGFGRSMHMKRQGGSIAYYVTNYPTVEEARLNINAIATVAMEFSPDSGGTTPYTKFYVFNGAGARVDQADLDGAGPKFIPRLCVVCHGGNAGSLSNGNNPNIGARFITFDLRSFQYSTFESPAFSGTFPFGRAAQAAQFKSLNRGVLDTNFSTSIQELVQGWYGGAGFPLVDANDNFVPSGWTGQSSLYLDVIAASCRTCHATRDAPVDWAVYADPANAGLKERGGTAKAFVCGPNRLMPQAHTTFLNFWLSTSPHQPAALAGGGLDFWSPTDPCPA